MENYRNAPKLYHEGSKPKGYFYQLPQRLMDAVFQKFDGKNGNAIKILVALIGTAGDGSFAISEKWIKARTGIGKQSYHRTMDSLVASGYVIKENGKVILNLPLLMEDKHDDDQESHLQAEMSTHDDETTQPDDDYNRKRTKNNKKITEKDLAVDENEKRIEDTLKRIGIHCAANTKQSLTTIIGEEPQASVLDEVVRKNFSVFEAAKNEPQGYRYGILKKILRTEYHDLKLKLEAERAEQEERRNQTRIDYSRFDRAGSTPQEGLDDISELLYDDDEDENPAPSNNPSQLQQVIAEMKRQRKADILDWDDDDEDDEL